MSKSDGNAVLVNVLSSSVRSALNGMETSPALIRRVLEEGAWRSFTTPRGEHIEHTTFESFVTTAPTAGLGQSVGDIVRLAADDKETLDILAVALASTVKDLHAMHLSSSAKGALERDAHDFGTHMRNGGWLLGLMVARNVQPHKPSRIPRQNSQRSDSSRTALSKVSATEFAVMAGCSKKRVMRFYRAWERAAAAGVVPDFEQLEPGVDIPLPEPELWSEHFVSYEKSTDRRENLAHQAEVAGTSYVKALTVANNPSALRTAILGDGKTAEAAFRAVLDRIEDDTDLQGAVARNIATMPEVRRAVSAEAKRVENADYVKQVATHGIAKTPGGEPITLTDAARQKINDELALLGDPGSDLDTAKAALAVVQDVVAEVISGDPEILVREHRVRVQKVLASTTRNIDSIGTDDLSEVADDEIREVIVALQEKINKLAESVSSAPPRRRLRAV